MHLTEFIPKSILSTFLILVQLHIGVKCHLLSKLSHFLIKYFTQWYLCKIFSKPPNIENPRKFQIFNFAGTSDTFLIISGLLKYIDIIMTILNQTQYFSH